MKLSVCLNVKDFRKEIERFLSTTSRAHWNKRIQQLKNTQGYLYKGHLKTRNPLLEPIWMYYDLESKGQSIQRNSPNELRFLAGNAYVINRIIHSINDIGKRRLVSRLKDEDIRAVLFEIATVTHFLRKNFDVSFVDYERYDNKGRIFDFLIKKNAVVAEVECKWKSLNAGKKITSDGFYILTDEIIKQLTGYKTSCFLTIKTPDRLGKNLTNFTGLALKIKDAITLHQSKALFNGFVVEIGYLTEKPKIDTNQQLKTIVKFGKTRNQHAASFSNGNSTIIIKVECEKKDVVLKTIYADLKKSLEQFSKKRSGLIVCNIEGILTQDWQYLKSESGLAAMATKLIEKEDAAHVHTVVFTSEDANQVMYSEAVETQRACLFFINPNTQFNKGVKIFDFNSTI